MSGRARCGTRAAAPAPSRRRQRPALLPDARRDRHPSEVVDERRPADRARPRRPRGRMRLAAAAASSATPAEWPAKLRARRGRRSHPSPRARGRCSSPASVGLGVGSQASSSSHADLVRRRSARRSAPPRPEATRSQDRRRAPRVAARSARRVLRAAEQCAGTWRLARRGRSARGAGSRRRGASEPAVAVPALGERANRALTEVGSPSRPASICATSQSAVRCGLPVIDARRQAPGDLRGTDGRRTLRIGQGADQAREDLALRPEHHRREVCRHVVPAKSSAVISASAVHPA